MERATNIRAKSTAMSLVYVSHSKFRGKITEDDLCPSPKPIKFILLGPRAVRSGGQGGPHTDV